MGVVYTLNGPIDAADLGPVLPHEHLPLHMPANETDEFTSVNRDLIYRWYEPVLDDLEATPFRTLVDVSPTGHGRDIEFRRELMKGRSVHVVMSTGFYVDDKQPQWAREQSADELTEFMVRELEEGIGDSGVRAGIIKLAPDAKSGQSRKVCRAAVEAAKKIGACITTHSCRRSRETFDLLTGYGLPPEKLYIGHADFVEAEENEYVCRAGAHVLYTVWGIDRFIPDELMYKRFAALVEKGHTENVLLSVDFAIIYQQNGDILWTLYDVPGRTHAYLDTTVIPKLKTDYGLGDEDLRVITEDNPRTMLDFR